MALNASKPKTVFIASENQRHRSHVLKCNHFCVYCRCSCMIFNLVPYIAADSNQQNQAILTSRRYDYSLFLLCSLLTHIFLLFITAIMIFRYNLWCAYEHFLLWVIFHWEWILSANTEPHSHQITIEFDPFHECFTSQ